MIIREVQIFTHFKWYNLIGGWKRNSDMKNEKGMLIVEKREGKLLRKDVILNMYIKYIVSSMLQPQAYLWLNPFQNEI